MIVYNHKKGEKPFIGFSPLSYYLIVANGIIYIPASSLSEYLPVSDRRMPR